MSYQVIARKWRPQSFLEVKGQSHITQTLKNALSQNRLPHALLFTGPRGTGKTSSARILAKALRCENSKDFQPCNVCNSCVEITNGSSMDVIEIDGASNNGVDAIRELRETVAFMPASGKYKIYIIDEVHMLSTSAFNALLKTLEEPPPHVIFIMATTEVHKIPQTILSRCQRFDFRRIPTRVITDLLKTICDADGHKADDDALWIIARQGDGSMRDAQSLLDQVITFANGPLTKENVITILGLTDRELLSDTLVAFVERDISKSVNVIKRLSASGIDPVLFCRELLEQIRNFLMIKISAEEKTELVDLPDSEVAILKSLTGFVSQEEAHLLFDMTLKMAQDVSRALDAFIALEVGLLRISQAPKIENIQKLIEQIKSGDIASSIAHPKGYVPPVSQPVKVGHNRIAESQKVSEVPRGLEAMKASMNESRTAMDKVSVLNKVMSKTESAPAKEVIAEKPKITRVDLSLSASEKWVQFVDLVRGEDALFAAKIENLLFIKEDGKLVTLSIPPKLVFLKDQMADPIVRKKLQGFIDSFWSDGYSFEVISGKTETGGVTAQQMNQQKVQLAEDDLKKRVEEDPTIRLAHQIFDTEIKTITELKK